MKHFLLAMALSLTLCTSAQTVIVQWTFPSGTSADATGVGSTSNSTRTMEAIGTSVIDFSKNGYTTKSAQTTGWDNGAGAKCWQVSFTTKGYAGFKLSSRQQTGGNNPGPRDFKLQYRLGDAGTWTDISGGAIVTANDWTTSFVNNLPLPAECENQDLVYVRWLMNSNVPSSGSGDVLASGISKIDDILITADLNTGIDEPNSKAGVSLFPNPVVNNILTIRSGEQSIVVNVFDLQGRCVKTSYAENGQVQIETSSLTSGIYIARIHTRLGVIQRKFILE